MFKESGKPIPTGNEGYDKEKFINMLENSEIRSELTKFLRKNFRLTNYDIKDVIQETLIKAINAINNDQFNGKEESLLPWLITIARNFTISWFKKKHREIPTKEVESIAQVEQNQAVWEKFSDLEKFLSLLKIENEEYYQIIYLFHLEGLTYKEISEKINKPIGTIMSRLFRARKLLNNIITKEKNKEIN